MLYPKERYQTVEFVNAYRKFTNGMIVAINKFVNPNQNVNAGEIEDMIQMEIELSQVKLNKK
jgi:translation initiation factor IF-2